MANADAHNRSLANEDLPSDISRDVYCILGMPVDAIEMKSCLRRVEAAVARRTPFLISTPNLNFLVSSQSDPHFRESLLQSDLCPADGVPVILIAWLLGVPIKGRVAGSDIFDALKANHSPANPLKLFFLGGAAGVAAAACGALNARPKGLYCVGTVFPGFGGVDEISTDEILNEINSSNADFLVVSLGAKKGQAWLLRNHHRLLVPVRAHLGAVINFQAAIIKRAPFAVRNLGLEWLWRIKEEPYLWRRYWNDGTALLYLMFGRVFPLLLQMWWLRLKRPRNGEGLVIEQVQNDESITLKVSGFAVARHAEGIIVSFRNAIAVNKPIIIDLSDARAVDARFLGLLIMLRKELKRSGRTLVLLSLPSQLRRLFHLSCLDFLLEGA